MGGLLHLVQRGGAWAGCGLARYSPRCTNRLPINGQCTNFILFDVALHVNSQANLERCDGAKTVTRARFKQFSFKPVLKCQKRIS